MTYVPNELLSRLVDEDLDSVIFIRDYVQLTFNGPTFSLFVWPVLLIGGDAVRFGDPGFRDALCSFISSKVISTSEEESSGIVIQFAHGAITIRPELRDIEGPEIGMLTNFVDSPDWMVWAPGDWPFSYLR